MQHLVVDVGRGTSLFCGKLGCLGTDDDLAKLLRVLVEPDIKIVGLSELEAHVVEALGLVSNVADFHAIGSTRAHTINGIHTFRVGHGLILRAGRHVNDLNCGSDNILAISGNLTTHAGSSDLRHHCCCKTDQQHEQE